MRVNLALWDRWLRGVLGFLFVVLVQSGGPGWMWIGVYFIMTAAWGWCPLYGLMRWRTASIERFEKWDEQEK